MVACCLVFAACKNDTKKEEAKENGKNQVEEKKECADDCCKKMMEDWKNFDNLTAEEKTQILEKKGGMITDMLSKVDLEKVECPNAKQAIQEFQTKWEGFAAADEAGKKALIDEFDNAEWNHFVIPQCCGEKEGCCKEECCKDCKDCKCCKEGCKDCKCKEGKKCENCTCEDCKCCKEGAKDCKK